jgi:hypothetical protein
MPGPSLHHLQSFAISARKREQRLQTFAVYGSLSFIALVVLSTLSHRLF